MSDDLREKVALIIDPAGFDDRSAAPGLRHEQALDDRAEEALTKADAILNLIGGGGWKAKGTEPAACTVIATRFDGCEWAYAVVETPLNQPFTHWRPLPPPPPVTP